MHFRTRTLAAALVVSLFNGTPFTALAEASEIVELSDKSGKTIKAKILLVVGEEVEIEMDGGKKYTLPISRFSLSSQEIIRNNGGSSEPAPAAAPPTNFDEEAIFAFTDLEFKDKKLDHFLIRTLGTNDDPAEKYAEDIFKIMAATIPSLPDLFAKQGFSAPRKNPNIHDFPEPDKLFRQEIYLVEESGDYQNLVTQYAASLPDERNRQNFINSTGTVGNFIDFNRRFLVIRKEAGQPKEQLLAHQLGIQLVGAKTAQANLPFWLSMGSGYYAEHKKFKKCTVYYVDFNNYYEQSAAGGAGDMTRAEILSNSEPWTKPLKELCKKEKRVNLDRLFKITTAELTPNDSGYTMALFSYMTSTPDLVAKFNMLLDQVKEGTAVDPQGVADLFGYATPEEFEAAWYAYILSPDFK